MNFGGGCTVGADSTDVANSTGGADSTDGADSGLESAPIPGHLRIEVIPDTIPTNAESTHHYCQ